MTTAVNVHDTVSDHLESNWTDTEISWDNIDFDPPTTAWIRPSISFDTTEFGELGNPGNNSGIRYGALYIQVFVPLNQGVRQALIYATDIENLFRRQSLDFIHFGEPTTTQAPSGHPNYSMVTVSTPFHTLTEEIGTIYDSGTSWAQATTLLALTDTPSAYAGAGDYGVYVSPGAAGIVFRKGNFLELEQTPTAWGAVGQILRVDATGASLEWATSAAGATNFVGLKQTPGAMGNPNQILAVAGTGSNATLTWVAQVNATGSTFSAPPNIVCVDPGGKKITGERYATWVSADAYAQAQVPAAANRWGIYISGTNNENIVIKSWTPIIGNDSTRLTGAITSAAGYAGDVSQSVIYRCIITNLGINNPANFINLDRCVVTGGTPTSGILLCVNGTSFTGNADLSSCGAFNAINTNVYANTEFPAGAVFYDSNIFDNVGAIFNGVLLRGSCWADLRGNTLNAGTYRFINCSVTGLEGTFATGYLFELVGCAQRDGYGPIILRNTGQLDLVGSAANATVTVNAGGVYNNTGISYKSSIPGTWVTPAPIDTQEAIQRIAAAVRTAIGTNIP